MTFIVLILRIVMLFIISAWVGIKFPTTDLFNKNGWKTRHQENITFIIGFIIFVSIYSFLKVNR